MDSLISVVVPIYNVERYLEKCIDSIINQSFEHLEIILVNDGSTDHSLEICEKYKAQDKRIKVLDKKMADYLMLEMPELKNLWASSLLL